MSEIPNIRDVNNELGDNASDILYRASTLTYANRPGLVHEAHQSFSGFRSIALGQFYDLNNLVMNLGFDGVGTKVAVAERNDDHSTIAHDLVAMVCDDAVVRGAEPIALGTIFDVRQLDDTEHTRQALRQLAYGYVAAAALARVVVVNGETAQLGERVSGYGTFSYNWGAAVLWLAHKERVLTGSELRPGDTLVGLAEPGFRSNGLTSVRKTMLQHYGDDWHNTVVPELGSATLGRQVAQPSIIYTPLITELTGGYDIRQTPRARVTGAAHITGGGQPSKIGRMLQPSGLGAEITDPLTPPTIMLKVQELAGISDEAAYHEWHMGSGMAVATPQPEEVLEVARARGIAAQAIGTVTKTPGIRIRNQGVRQDSAWLDFAPHD